MRVLGIDFGQRRIGLAISDASATLARPLRTIERGPSLDRTIAELVTAIEQTVAGEEPVVKIVIGLPKHLDGTESDQTRRVREFAERLGSFVTVPIVFHDERLSSREAESLLALRERDWRIRKKRLDAAAAAVILQSYLDQERATWLSAPESGL